MIEASPITKGSSCWLPWNRRAFLDLSYLEMTTEYFLQNRRYLYG